MMRQRESRRPHPDDERSLAGRRSRKRPSQIEWIPAREQRVDLEAPGQRQHVLQQPGLGLGNIDRILLLIDARLHAVVADAMTRRRHERVIDADHRQRAKRPAVGTQPVELGDLFLERAAGKRHAERGLLERRGAAIGGLLVAQARRARILLLLVTPDAVVRLVEAAGEIGAWVGQREPVAAAQMIVGEPHHLDAVTRLVLDRYEPHVVELARRPE